MIDSQFEIVDSMFDNGVTRLLTPPRAVRSRQLPEYSPELPRHDLQSVVLGCRDIILVSFELLAACNALRRNLKTSPGARMQLRISDSKFQTSDSEIIITVADFDISVAKFDNFDSTEARITV